MKKIIFGLIILFSGFSGFSQDDEILLEVGGNKITVGNFLHIYNKNSGSEVEKKDLNEYIEMYINFKLKVLEAQNLKMDTSQAFKDELAGYSQQLAKNYSVENKVVEKMMKRAYERNKTEIKFDHILIKAGEGADVKVKNEAYEKALKIKKRLDSGEDFDKVAAEVSDDKSASRLKGHFWYIPAAKIPLKIQEFGLNDKTGKFSDPIFVGGDYHIVRVMDKRPALGSVKVAHIMIMSPATASEKEKENAKKTIDSIYAKLKSGEKFEDLLKHSQDKGTASKGGELPWFTTGKMVPEFETAAFAIPKKSDYTEPVKTDFGWHIIKLLDKKDYPTYEESEKSIQKMVNENPEMSQEIKNEVIEILKKEFQFEKVSHPKELLTAIDSTIFQGIWELNSDLQLQNKLFTLVEGKSSNKTAKVIFNELDLANFIAANQVKQKSITIKDYLEKANDNFIYRTLIDAEAETLEEKFPEYKYLINEYYDGILLFDITDSVVWKKAVSDSIGLRNFFETNKNEYRTKLKINISIFEYTDEKILKKAKPVIADKLKDNLSDQDIVQKVSGGKDNFKFIETGEYAQGDNEIGDIIIEMKKKSEIIENQKFVILQDNKLIVALNSIQETDTKDFEEIRGIIIADYQNKLEEDWIKQLRSKYKVKVNKDILEKIK